ncbi:hypothetical protein [Mucilaginibacter sp. SG564]|uniref:hypothetical protein n=1 Tax=Mucilaginibacter sp. SG564 TaxID=2587022 RepID=UPI0015520E05|nr:hypothetical protein [Mucilaginibacter sp. SG564]NOW98924.1 hypothetical protein [Mucilaginibacter sp. SG564]
MVKIKIRFQGRLSASSLMEAVIAMVIMVLVFGIAMMIYTNVTRLSLSVRKIRAQAILQERLYQTVKNGNTDNQHIQVDEFEIEQKVSPFGPGSGLIQIELTAFGENHQQLVQLQQIISHANEAH